ncbi:MAG: YchF family ATPase [Syntrophales bacterium]|jgi:GTP-binding protein YchF|nr:YchF family ATPase [Syntrophales bacterium]MCK9527910.1 YchF family ATPase [Syntrophales bacterium]MDX9921914.1 DUF933 domain-containing protein [Syntrophales bacterium]
MKIGLLGLPGSGKTTIFNALTGMQAPVGGYASAKTEPNLAVVTVADDRVNRLAQIYKPKKTVFATVECVDFVGFSKDSTRDSAFSASQTALIKTLDALALVIRNFDDVVEGEPTPVRDLEIIETELLLADLILVEQRREKIARTMDRGKKTAELQSEEQVLKSVQAYLDDNRPLRTIDFTGDEERLISGFQFLSRKPVMVVVNSSEIHFGSSGSLIRALEGRFRVIEFAGLFEMELSRLSDEEEAKLFMEDMGITESARHRLTRFAYETLGYISFLTVGPDEVRAWTLRRGASALEAARTIHSDLARGFIRAECYTYDDLVHLGSEKAAREQGRFRLEGKDYTVQDGDVLNIRFSV